LIYFFCHCFQNNLFNFKTLDSNEFSSRFSYDIGFLRRKHPNPAQHTGLSDEEKQVIYDLQEEDPAGNRVFDSYLENALYNLSTKPLVFQRGVKTVSRNGDSVEYNTKCIYRLKTIPNFS